ncbi:MAG: glycosyltransferase [Pseudothermotoga sp.]|uniref:glycosyltransferase n=1 Tax=Pseudothermotoga sp. TaxID=2033661 RepID=UPI00258E3C1A|nr:glycosyltransferase [Pseudothermotoga sp.]MDI6863883.1 glycosyltransferase [Pseudothermotoga sp.]
MFKLKHIDRRQDEKKLKKLAGKLDIADRVSWLGFRKDPYSDFREITALLLTSRHEGFPMVLVEANQRGIAVITSDCESGPKDIVIPGVNGYLYREGDMDEFVRIVSDVIDGKLSFDTSENIVKTAERFREDVVVENIYKALREIVTK